jgi:hypothetical protein
MCLGKRRHKPVARMAAAAAAAVAYLTWRLVGEKVESQGCSPRMVIDRPIPLIVARVTCTDRGAGMTPLNSMSRTSNQRNEAFCVTLKVYRPRGKWKEKFSNSRRRREVGDRERVDGTCY